MAKIKSLNLMKGDVLQGVGPKNKDFRRTVSGFAWVDFNGKPLASHEARARQAMGEAPSLVFEEGGVLHANIYALRSMYEITRNGQRVFV